MTITYTRYVEPLPSADATNGKRSPKPPPRIWQAIDPPFKGYQPAPSEAYQQSSRDTAVVIDNGMHRPVVEHMESVTVLKVLVLSVLDGLLMLLHDSRFRRTSLDTVTGNIIGLSHMSATTHMPMLRREAKSEMLSSLEQAS